MDDKNKKIKARMDKFMAETAADMFDEETFKLADESIKKNFKECEIPYTRASLKAFGEGINMALVAHEQGGLMMATSLMLSIRKLISDLESKVAKVSSPKETPHE